MSPINPDYLAGIKRALAQAPYFQLLGMELIDLQPGRSEFRLAVERKHIQPWGIAHGGVMASLLDATAFWAVASLAEDGASLTTVDLQVKYLAPVNEGQVIIGRGRAVNLGRRLGLGTARIIDQATDRVMAHATSSLMVIDAPMPGHLAALPPKFID